MKTETAQHVAWKSEDNRILQRFYNESWNKQVPASVEDVEIGKFNSCEQAEQAVRAVNAHEFLVNVITAATRTKTCCFCGLSEKIGHDPACLGKAAIAKAEGR